MAPQVVTLKKAAVQAHKRLVAREKEDEEARANQEVERQVAADLYAAARAKVQEEMEQAKVAAVLRATELKEQFAQQVQLRRQANNLFKSKGEIEAEIAKTRERSKSAETLSVQSTPSQTEVPIW